MGFNQQIFAVSAVCLLLLANRAPAQQVDALYNSADGGVTFLYDTEYEDLAGIRLDSADALLLQGKQIRPSGALSCLCIVADQAPFFLEWGNLLGFNFDSEFVGFILPAGLTQETLDSDLTLRYRTLAAPTEDRFGQFILVPEPGTWLLALLGVSHCLFVRRPSGR